MTRNERIDLPHAERAEDLEEKPEEDGDEPAHPNVSPDCLVFHLYRGLCWGGGIAMRGQLKCWRRGGGGGGEDERLLSRDLRCGRTCSLETV